MHAPIAAVLACAVLVLLLPALLLHDTLKQWNEVCVGFATVV
jgi:hypothetical protein